MQTPVAEQPKKVVRIIEPTISAQETVNSTYRAIRVAAYCRVSTKQEEQLNSHENQVKHYTDRINAEPGWILEGIYADATDIIGLKQNPTNGRRFSPIFSFIGYFFDTKRENATSKAKEEN